MCDGHVFRDCVRVGPTCSRPACAAWAWRGCIGTEPRFWGGSATTHEHQRDAQQVGPDRFPQALAHMSRGIVRGRAKERGGPVVGTQASLPLRRWMGSIRPRQGRNDADSFESVRGTMSVTSGVFGFTPRSRTAREGRGAHEPRMPTTRCASRGSSSPHQAHGSTR